MSDVNVQCLGAAFLPYLALVLIINLDSENRIPVVAKNSFSVDFGESPLLGMWKPEPILDHLKTRDFVSLPSLSFTRRYCNLFCGNFGRVH